ncbi:WD40-like domain-containing protein [Tieghemostelium lacteum]|uniref:WD40-like domain-containing protein n=1 Tax=Tieghemostelium lacteum TaxID=361077 RepID=A0A152A7A8_TIELA|nr:WD40-like domain-containing protein [Tieghemostelium lacteum]|eukprot:KYR02015.1 WD40-like domain-containing protein [Tieghemostelium lacteum]
MEDQDSIRQNIEDIKQELKDNQGKHYDEIGLLFNLLRNILSVADDMTKEEKDCFRETLERLKSPSIKKKNNEAIEIGLLEIDYYIIQKNYSAAEKQCEILIQKFRTPLVFYLKHLSILSVYSKNYSEEVLMQLIEIGNNENNITSMVYHYNKAMAIDHIISISLYSYTSEFEGFKDEFDYLKQLMAETTEKLDAITKWDFIQRMEFYSGIVADIVNSVFNDTIENPQKRYLNALCIQQTNKGEDPQIISEILKQLYQSVSANRKSQETLITEARDIIKQLDLSKFHIPQIPQFLKDVSLLNGSSSSFQLSNIFRKYIQELDIKILFDSLDFQKYIYNLQFHWKHWKSYVFFIDLLKSGLFSLEKFSIFHLLLFSITVQSETSLYAQQLKWQSAAKEDDNDVCKLTDSGVEVVIDAYQRSPYIASSTHWVVWNSLMHETFPARYPSHNTLQLSKIKEFFTKLVNGDDRLHPLTLLELGCKLPEIYDLVANNETIKRFGGNALKSSLYQFNQNDTQIKLFQKVLEEGQNGNVPLPEMALAGVNLSTYYENKKDYRMAIECIQNINTPITNLRYAKLCLDTVNQNMTNTRYKESHFKNLLKQMGTKLKLCENVNSVEDLAPYFTATGVNLEDELYKYENQTQQLKQEHLNLQSTLSMTPSKPKAPYSYSFDNSTSDRHSLGFSSSFSNITFGKSPIHTPIKFSNNNNNSIPSSPFQTPLKMDSLLSALETTTTSTPTETKTTTTTTTTTSSTSQPTPIKEVEKVNVFDEGENIESFKQSFLDRRNRRNKELEELKNQRSVYSSELQSLFDKGLSRISITCDELAGLDINIDLPSKESHQSIMERLSTKPTLPPQASPSPSPSTNTLSTSQQNLTTLFTNNVQSAFTTNVVKQTQTTTTTTNVNQVPINIFSVPTTPTTTTNAVVPTTPTTTVVPPLSNLFVPTTPPTTVVSKPLTSETTPTPTISTPSLTKPTSTLVTPVLATPTSTIAISTPTQIITTPTIVEEEEKPKVEYTFEQYLNKSINVQYIKKSLVKYDIDIDIDVDELKKEGKSISEIKNLILGLIAEKKYKTPDDNTIDVETSTTIADLGSTLNNFKNLFDISTQSTTINATSTTTTKEEVKNTTSPIEKQHITPSTTTTSTSTTKVEEPVSSLPLPGKFVFGSNTFTTNIFGNTTAPTSSFGSSTPSTSAFGSSTPSTSAFGSSTPSTSAFGSSTPSTSAFGSSTPLTSAFGSSTPSTSAFGSSTPSTSAFGSSTPSTSAFGSFTPSASAFGSSTPSTSAFGSSNLSTSAFGSSTPSTSVFGSSTPSTSVFGGAPKSIFGSSNSVFGKTSTETPLTFGTITQASTSSSVFGNPVPPVTSAFGTPVPPVPSVFGSTPKPSANTEKSPTNTPEPSTNIFASSGQSNIFGSGTNLFGGSAVKSDPSKLVNAFGTSEEKQLKPSESKPEVDDKKEETKPPTETETKIESEITKEDLSEKKDKKEDTTTTETENKNTQSQKEEISSIKFKNEESVSDDSEVDDEDDDENEEEEEEEDDEEENENQQSISVEYENDESEEEHESNNASSEEEDEEEEIKEKKPVTFGFGSITPEELSKANNASTTDSSSTGFTYTKSSNSVFGASDTVSQPTSIFGQPTSSSVFGQPSGTSTSSIFSQSSGTSVFGQPSGTSASNSTSIFGQPSGGSANNSTSIFGQSSSTSIFGQPSGSSASNSTSIFGQSSSTSTGQKTSASGTVSQQTSVFGQPTSPKAEVSPSGTSSIEQTSSGTTVSKQSDTPNTLFDKPPTVSNNESDYVSKNSDVITSQDTATETSTIDVSKNSVVTTTQEVTTTETSTIDVSNNSDVTSQDTTTETSTIDVSNNSDVTTTQEVTTTETSTIDVSKNSDVTTSQDTTTETSTIDISNNSAVTTTQEVTTTESSTLDISNNSDLIVGEENTETQSPKTDTIVKEKETQDNIIEQTSEVSTTISTPTTTENIVKTDETKNTEIPTSPTLSSATNSSSQITTSLFGTSTNPTTSPNTTSIFGASTNPTTSPITTSLFDTSTNSPTSLITSLFGTTAISETATKTLRFDLFGKPIEDNNESEDENTDDSIKLKSDNSEESKSSDESENSGESDEPEESSDEESNESEESDTEDSSFKKDSEITDDSIQSDNEEEDEKEENEEEKKEDENSTKKPVLFSFGTITPIDLSNSTKDSNTIPSTSNPQTTSVFDQPTPSIFASSNNTSSVFGVSSVFGTSLPAQKPSSIFAPTSFTINNTIGSNIQSVFSNSTTPKSTDKTTEE